MTNDERDERLTASRVRSVCLRTYHLTRSVRDDVRQRTDENDPRLKGLIWATHLAFRQLTLVEGSLASDRGIPAALTHAARNSTRLATLIHEIIAYDRMGSEEGATA